MKKTKLLLKDLHLCVQEGRGVRGKTVYTHTKIIRIHELISAMKSIKWR